MTEDAASELNQLATLNRFAISLLRENSLEDLLWKMSANIGELLGFEDCVIYLREHDELVQCAAYGIKNPTERSIKNEIRISIGDGIVGAAALNGKTEYVADLSADERYIPDEFSGRSELAVPLIAEDEVIGVLDSESSRIDGFSELDRQMFESLANIAAPRIASALAHRQRERAEQALREAKIEAERANQAKSEFLSRMSHEIKTPLNAMLGFANLMKFEAGEGADPRLDKILISGQHLLALVNESLDVIRVEQNSISLDLKSVDVVDVIEECIAMLLPDAQQMGVSVEFSGSAPRMVSDRQRLRQILLNLISNAIKYNRRGGSVRVEASAGADHSVELVVEDDGIGISESDLQKLFKPFTRFGERATKVEGHGIGMTISKQLTEALGGSIQVSSEPGKGTRFSLRLPDGRQQSVA